MAVLKRANSPYWQIEFEFDGQRARRSSGTSRKRDAEELERQWRRELHDQLMMGKVAPISPPTPSMPPSACYRLSSLDRSQSWEALPGRGDRRGERFAGSPPAAGSTRRPAKNRNRSSRRYFGLRPT